MSNELAPLTNLYEDSWRFYPSHLTKGIICVGLSFAFAAFAVREFSKVEKEEVMAMVFGDSRGIHGV